MKDKRIEKEMYLYNLEEAFCMEEEGITLYFHINRAEMWLTEFNKHNGIGSN